MIGSSLVWRMALRNLRQNWKQTLLTIIAGAIGGMLIAISVVNYDSVQRSGDEWIEQRLGPIAWKLKPRMPEAGLFSQNDVDSLVSAASQGSAYFVLPYVATEATMIRQQTASGEEESAMKALLLLGFPMEAAAKLEQDRASLWQRGLQEDEVILARENAELLGAAIGDAVTVITGHGEKLLRVRDVIEERGLTGFRESGSFTGTIIASERTVRELAGADENGYPAVLVGARDADTHANAIFYTDKVAYDIEYLKSDYQNKVRRMNFSVLMGLISMVAIASSMLFMRQVLVMIGESRRELYGILRAIGLSRGQIGGMFLVEALLLSLLSALSGTIIGIAAGYGFVKLFFGMYAEELARMTGAHIVIQPHITAGSAIIVSGAIFLFLSFIAMLAAVRASNIRIVEALRGEGGDGVNGAKRGGGMLNKLLLGFGIYCIVVHVMLGFVVPPNLNAGNTGGQMLLISITWIGTCFTVLFFVIYAMGKANKPFIWMLSKLGLPPISIMLATKYPRSHPGRTYTTSLLFALVMMTITFVVSIMGVVMANGDVERKDQTIFGFGAYASYRTAEERERIKAIASEDSVIKEHVEGSFEVEPYMLIMSRDNTAQAIVPVSEGLLQAGAMELLKRAPEFDSDEQAWRAVLNDPRYIILPHDYLYHGHTDGRGAGDQLTLPIYKSGLTMANETRTPVAEETFIIAGFVHDTSRSVAIDFFGATFVHASVAERFKPLGSKWPNQTDLGFVMFLMNYRDMKLAQALEERFAVNGVMTFQVPYVNNSAAQIVNKQYGNGFIGFAICSAVIGLMGLAVVQYRAVRDRSRQVAMMRCIGVAGRQIYWMFLLEGFVISLVGLLTGWAVGSSGAHLFIAAINSETLPHEEVLRVQYPFEILLPILAGLLTASLLLNVAPARAALKLKAADALRRGND